MSSYLLFGAASVAIALFAAAAVCLRRQIPLEVKPVLTYEEAAGWLHDHRPELPLLSGVIRREARCNGYLIELLYLAPCERRVRTEAGSSLGKYILARNIDQQLRDAFGNEDLIVVG
jgi:hypothetical protein